MARNRIHLSRAHHSFVAAAVALAFQVGGCTPKARKFPWPLAGAPKPVEHAAVETVNPGYDRTRSNVLVRRIATPTRANLDYAAYHANVMIYDAPPEGEVHAADPSLPIDTRGVFGGLVVVDSITPSIDGTSLSDEERRRAMAFSPLVDWVAKWNYKLSGGLEDLRSAVRSETWGGGGGPHIIRQRATDAFLHTTEAGSELWIKIEFQPWLDEFTDMPDEDGDGFAEIYVRAVDEVLSPDVAAFIRDDYIGKLLDRDAVDTWANELGSYWYPSYNTDLVAPSSRWPDDDTDAAVRGTLAGATFEKPTVVMLGKPQGAPIYNLFLVEGLADVLIRTATGTLALGGKGFAVEAVTEPLTQVISAELKSHGTWDQWAAELKPLHARVRADLSARDASLKTLIGRDGFLFYRASLDQMISGDLRHQPKGKDPLPVIVEFKEMLAEAGVDFLFVPVPTKAAIFPDKLRRSNASLAGTIVSPYERKLLGELSQAGVEIVDLLPLYLAERGITAEQDLYLAQDTHWTDRGLQIAARAISERIKAYPWYAELAKSPTAYKTKRVKFTHQGDLPSRLADSEQARYRPLELPGTQVVTPSGELFVDVAESPITVLGDSFTGVYQRTFCRHAGLSAHVAKGISFPVDLVMSYGGGPNVRKKLLRRGEDALKNERLIIWVMAARDLYNYWEDWELLESK